MVEMGEGEGNNKKKIHKEIVPNMLTSIIADIQNFKKINKT